MSTIPSRSMQMGWPQATSLFLGSGFRIEFPSYRDPRYLIWLCQLLFYVLGVEYLNFAKGYAVLAYCLATGVVVDLFFIRRLQGKWIFPQSGIVTATGVALLLEASVPWLYVSAVAIALASKYVFSFGGRHYFNPTTFGLLCVVSFFPAMAVTNATQWTGSSAMWALITALGVFSAWYARVFDMALAWVCGYYLFAFLRVAAGTTPPVLTYSIPFGSSFALYTFFMITDPRTMPAGKRARLLFALSVAGLDAILRSMRLPNSIYAALAGTQYLWALTYLAKTRAATRSQPCVS